MPFKSDALRRKARRDSDVPGQTEADCYRAARKACMAVGRDFENLL
jgi:hypothetical protein